MSGRLVLFVLAALACAPPGVMAGKEMAGKESVCEEAEQRYRAIFGQPSDALKDEGVFVVKMYKYTFCPPQVRVKPGTTVRWVNVDRRTSHSVWFRDAGREESERIFPDPEEKVEMTFDLPPGEYPYLCGPHWQAEGMVGKVIVDPKAACCPP